MYCMNFTNSKPTVNLKAEATSCVNKNDIDISTKNENIL